MTHETKEVIVRVPLDKEDFIRRGYVMGLEAAARKAEGWSHEGGGIEVLDNLAKSIQNIDPAKGF